MAYAFSVEPAPAPIHCSSGIPVKRCIHIDEDDVLPLPISPKLIMLHPVEACMSLTTSAPLCRQRSNSSSVIAGREGSFEWSEPLFIDYAMSGRNVVVHTGVNEHKAESVLLAKEIYSCTPFEKWLSCCR